MIWEERGERLARKRYENCRAKSSDVECQPTQPLQSLFNAYSTSESACYQWTEWKGEERILRTKNAIENFHLESL